MRFTSDMGIEGSRRQASGEQRLACALLEDCLRTLLGKAGGERGEWLERDLAWITSEDRSDVFTFENVCDALGIDAGYLRARVLAARARLADDRRAERRRA